MFHLLSFTGRWDPRFFEDTPVSDQGRQPTEEQKQVTRAAAKARSQLKRAEKYAHCIPLYPVQAQLVTELHDGTLEAEATRLTLLSGHGQLKRQDGTFLNIGGSTGGWTRAAMYDWEAPIIEDESWNQSDGWNPSDWSDGWNHHHGWNWSDGWKSTHQW